MPRQASIPSQTYAPGVYGPFVVNNIDAADRQAYFVFGGAAWGAALVTITIEARVGNDPWFSMARSVNSWQGPFVNKYTGETVTEGRMVTTLPYVGAAQRDLRATIEVSGGPVTSGLVAGTL